MMHKKGGIRLAGIVLLLVCSMAFLAGCKAAQTQEKAEKEKESYKKLSAKEAKERIDSGDNIVVIDARTQKEYDYMHVSGAVLIPTTDIGEEPLADIPALDQEILLYSSSTTESRFLAEKLAKAGYTNVAEFGSMDDWPYAVEMSDDSPAAST